MERNKSTKASPVWRHKILVPSDLCDRLSRLIEIVSHNVWFIGIEALSPTGCRSPSDTVNLPDSTAKLVSVADSARTDRVTTYSECPSSEFTVRDATEHFLRKLPNEKSNRNKSELL
jgi:hypothetical protein